MESTGGKVYQFRQTDRAVKMKQRVNTPPMARRKRNATMDTQTQNTQQFAQVKQIRRAARSSSRERDTKKRVNSKQSVKYVLDEEDASHRWCIAIFFILFATLAIYGYRNFSTTPRTFDYQLPIDHNSNQRGGNSFFTGFWTLMNSDANSMDETRFQNIVQQQMSTIHKQINGIIENEMKRTRSSLSSSLNQELSAMSAQIQRISQQGSYATPDQLNQVRRRVEELSLQLANSHSSSSYSGSSSAIDNSVVQRDLKEIQQRIAMVNAEVEKYRYYEERISNLHKQVDDINNRGRITSQNLQNFETQSSSTQNDLRARIQQLETQIRDIENSKNQIGGGVSASELEEIVKQNIREGMNEDIMKNLVNDYFTKNPVRFDIGDGGSLVELQESVTENVRKEFHRLFYEDTVGLPDYALSAVGASVVDYTGKWGVGNIVRKVLPIRNSIHSPSIILEPSTDVGDCWGFEGAKAFISIRLASPILPESISLDHISASISHSPDIASAPREFRVYGFATGGANAVLLGEFEFDKNGEQVQTFSVLNEAKSKAISVVKVEFLSNQGAEYTCVYRVRVHGTAVNIQSK